MQYCKVCIEERSRLDVNRRFAIAAAASWKYAVGEGLAEMVGEHWVEAERCSFGQCWSARRL